MIAPRSASAGPTSTLTRPSAGAVGVAAEVQREDERHGAGCRVAGWESTTHSGPGVRPPVRTCPREYPARGPATVPGATVCAAAGTAHANATTSIDMTLRTAGTSRVAVIASSIKKDPRQGPSPRCLTSSKFQTLHGTRRQNDTAQRTQRWRVYEVISCGRIRCQRLSHVDRRVDEGEGPWSSG